MVSQLDQAKEFRLLSLEEFSLRDFLEEQISALQPVVEAKRIPILPWLVTASRHLKTQGLRLLGTVSL
jgi:hypothetical protein